MILILAFTYQEARQIARRSLLSGPEWRWFSDREMHGRTNYEIWIAECWYDVGRYEKPTPNFPNGRHVFPTNELLDMAEHVCGATRKRVACA